MKHFPFIVTKPFANTFIACAVGVAVCTFGSSIAARAQDNAADVSTPPALLGPPVSTPPASIHAISSSINVLILALDDEDIRSARPSNLRDTESLRPRPALPRNNTTPQNNAVPPGELAPELPAAPARPRVPGNEFPLDELPAITPMAADSKHNFSIVRRAMAQAAPIIPELPLAQNSDLEIPNRRPPGRAQIAAAPVRRALAAMGANDILVTPLDGPTIVRVVNTDRLDIRVLDRLRFATQQMVETPVAQPEETVPELTQARRTAIRTATRVGLAMSYRAVVVLAVSPTGRYSVLLVDAEQGTGEVLNDFDSTDAGFDRAQSVASNIAARLSGWPIFTPADRASRLEKHLEAARAAIEENDREAAQDHLSQAVLLDASNADAYILLGDVLQTTDPTAAATAYQRAVEINNRNGEVWARIAIVHTLSEPPDWVRSLQAAERAQSLGYDSANLRTAQATAEFGRADLFRRNGRPDRAEDTELAASRHLVRAREMAPDDPEVAVGVSRLMAKYLLEQKRYSDAVQSLDLLAVQYPDDLQTQRMHAQALEGHGRREEDLFSAWARVWRLSGESEVVLDASRYGRIADGFDQRVFALARNVFQLTSGVATGSMPRENALLQAERARDEMKTATDALQIMRPSAQRNINDAHVARLFAADLMSQAVEFYLLYLETGADINRSRGVETHRQAIESLNAARLKGR